MNLFTHTKNSPSLDSNQIGGKAFYLQKIQKANLKVPNFIILSVDLINTILLPIRDTIENILSDSTFLIASNKIEQLIMSLDITANSKNQIHQACIDNFGINYSVAVRSSAVDEDGKSNSFAGLHTSYLYVNDTLLFFKIKKCISSAWSLNALSYRHQKGISLRNIQYAIVIQNMVNAIKSGVGFSMNTQGNMASMIVVAGYGLGEGVVSDLVETDTYTVDRLNGTISKNIHTKENELIYHNKKIIVKELPANKKTSAVLTNNEIEQVAKMLQKAEILLEAIADIEFSFTEDGTLFILQMRPVTGINMDDLKILDNTNIVESYPEVSLPLTASFVNDAYQSIFTNVAKSIWLSSKTRKSIAPVFVNLLGFHQGRIYYRLDNWFRMMSTIFPSKKAMASWEKAVGLKKEKQDEKYISYGNKIRVFLSIFKLLIFYKKGNNYFFKAFEKDYAFLQSFKNKKYTEEKLLEHIEKASSRINKYWHYTLINDLFSFKSFGLLQRLLKKHKIGNASLANDLLSGQINSDSEKAITQLLLLKEEISMNSELSSLFSKSNATIIKGLLEDKFAAFKSKTQKFLEVYGDRTLSELKLETTSLRNDANKFIDLLKSQLATDTNITSYQNKQKEIFKKATQQVNNNLKYYELDKYIFQFALKLSKYGLRNRENMRFSRTRVYGAIKDIYLEIGAIMQQKKIIKNKTDIFYLYKEEVKDLSTGCFVTNVFKKIEERKVQFENYEKQETPNRIVYIDFPPFSQNTNSAKISKNKKLLTGIAVSKGTVIAKAKIVLKPSYSINLKGKILVSKITDPGWVFLMSQSVGLVSERGSLLSHTAIIGRELGIPVVVGVENCTSLIKNQDTVELNGDLGTVLRMED